MFGNWNFMRLRAAETCLRDGRLDEAFERLGTREFVDNPRAKNAVAELATALTARARLHLQAGRYREALADLGRVESLGKLTEDARTLQKRAMDELAGRAERHGEDARAADQVAQAIQAGHLDTGRLGIEQLENARKREALREALDVRRQRADELLQQARAALGRDDLIGACRAWREARQRHGVTAESDALGPALASALTRRLQTAWRDGRMEQFRGLYDHMTALQEFDPILGGLAKALDLAETAARSLAAGAFDDLRDNLARLRAAAPGGDWLASAIESAERLLQARGNLLGSPIGSLSGATVEVRTPGAAARAAGNPVPQMFGDAPLLLLIDGTGSVVVTSRNIVRIGRAGGLRGIDVPIPADVQSHHADIVRDGENYFIVAHGPVAVNRRRVERALLRDGDRVELGEGARFSFRQPSGMSASATLKLSDRCRLPQDVYRVVLLADMFALGPGASSHVQTREGDSRLILLRSSEGLQARRIGRDGRAEGGAIELPLGRTSEVGDQRLTVQRYELDQRGHTA